MKDLTRCGKSWPTFDLLRTILTLIMVIFLIIIVFYEIYYKIERIIIQLIMLNLNFHYFYRLLANSILSFTSDGVLETQRDAAHGECRAQIFEQKIFQNKHGINKRVCNVLFVRKIWKRKFLKRNWVELLQLTFNRDLIDQQDGIRMRKNERLDFNPFSSLWIRP